MSECAATVLSAAVPLRLRAGVHSAWVAPQAGGRLLSLESRRADGTAQQWLAPLAQQQWPAAQWPKGGCYPLVPFSNRVRAGRFSEQGIEHQLDTLEPQAHALHGYGQYRPWQVEQHGEAALTLVYRHGAGEGGWPWAFCATQTFTLSGAGLTMTMALCNLSAQPMPAGMGFHPYFSAAQVELDAAWQWPHDADEIALRREPATVRPQLYSRTAAGYTDYLSGWDGAAHLQWPGGAQLSLAADAVFGHVVVHCAPGRDYLCVEPVSHVSDAFNLAQAGIGGTGMQRLAPHEAMQGRVVLRLLPN